MRSGSPRTSMTSSLATRNRHGCVLWMDGAAPAASTMRRTMPASARGRYMSRYLLRPGYRHRCGAPAAAQSHHLRPTGTRDQSSTGRDLRPGRAGSRGGTLRVVRHTPQLRRCEMRAVIIFESMYGNTHAIADAIGRGLGPEHEVSVVPVAEATPELLDG